MARTDSKAAMDTINTINAKLAQAAGICSAVGIAVDHAEVVPEEGLRNALWGAKELIEEAQKAADSLHRAYCDATKEAA